MESKQVFEIDRLENSFGQFGYRVTMMVDNNTYLRVYFNFDRDTGMRDPEIEIYVTDGQGITLGQYQEDETWTRERDSIAAAFGFNEDEANAGMDTEPLSACGYAPFYPKLRAMLEMYMGAE